MSAYCFFDLREINDQAKVEQYLAGVAATVAQYGGRCLVLGGGIPPCRRRLATGLSCHHRIWRQRTGAALVCIARIRAAEGASPRRIQIQCSVS